MYISEVVRYIHLRLSKGTSDNIRKHKWHSKKT